MFFYHTSLFITIQQTSRKRFSYMFLSAIEISAIKQLVTVRSPSMVRGNLHVLHRCCGTTCLPKFGGKQLSLKNTTTKIYLSTKCLQTCVDRGSNPWHIWCGASRLYFSLSHEFEQLYKLLFVHTSFIQHTYCVSGYILRTTLTLKGLKNTAKIMIMQMCHFFGPVDAYTQTAPREYPSYVWALADIPIITTASPFFWLNLFTSTFRLVFSSDLLGLCFRKLTFYLYRRIYAQSIEVKIAWCIMIDMITRFHSCIWGHLVFNRILTFSFTSQGERQLLV